MDSSPTDTAPLSVQVVIDCASPHELADWWAETLSWEVEPQDESFRASLIERGATETGGGRQGPHRWVTMADPEGNEFCVDA